MAKQPPIQTEFGPAYDLGVVGSNHQIPLYPIPLRDQPSPTAIDVRGDLPSITEALTQKRRYETYRNNHQYLMVWMLRDDGYRRAINSIREQVGLPLMKLSDLKQYAALSDGHAPDVYQTHLDEMLTFGRKQRNDTQAAERDLINRIHEQ
ncbi:hypothetical protein HYS47_00880 [Candidatus Woesearchaeota archaeon]|nr:hypothetical protein [Candidatus Woesearchaeota archaeon]